MQKDCKYRLFLEKIKFWQKNCRGPAGGGYLVLGIWTIQRNLVLGIWYLVFGIWTNA